MATFTEFQILMAVHKASGDGNPKAHFHATAKRIAQQLEVSESDTRELLRLLVDAGLVEIYQAKRRFTFAAYRLTESGLSALGAK